MKYHKSLTFEKWTALPQDTQILNIGTEISRAQNWQNLNQQQKVKECLERALELLDLTTQDPRWQEKIGDLLRLREALAYFYLFGSAPIIYKIYLDYLNNFASSFQTTS